MNNYQQNRYKMYGMVKHFLEKNGEQLMSHPGYREKYEDFCTHYAGIERAKTDQNMYSGQESVKKKELRKALQDQILVVSRRLKIYALMKEDNILLANCGISRWELLRKTQVDLTVYGGNLKRLAEKVTGDLVPYGITSDILKRLGDSVDAFNNMIADPRSMKVNSSVATLKMAREYKEADKALDFIDLVAMVKGESDAGFYSEYKSMRKQLKAGSVKMALKGNAIEAVSRKPLENVIFTLTHRSDGKQKTKKIFQIVKKTKGEGGFKVMHLPPGKYDVVARKSGYRDAELEILIIASELSRVVVEMVKKPVNE